MFIRPVHVIKNGKRHAYWALVESYRTKRGPRQRTVVYLGQADKQGRLGLKQAATGAGRCYQRQLFDDIEPDWVQVDTKRIRVERCLDFGGPWLALWLLNRLGLDARLVQLLPNGREEIPWSLMALVLVTGRFCDPSSELYIAEHFYKRTALYDLLGIAPQKVNDDRLYRALDHLLLHKAALEVYLKQRLGELFDLRPDPNQRIGNSFSTISIHLIVAL